MILKIITITNLVVETSVTGYCHLVRFQPDHGDGIHILVDSGIVYIPAFALGRTQELIYELDRINPGVPVFIDSPLGIEITRLYQDMDDCWDREAKALKAAGDHPIRFNHLYAVEKFQDHRRLLHLTGPALIIAGSGMCTGGRIVNHLKHGLDDPKNDLFFVGYQAKGTPGRDIVEGRTPAKAAIHRLSGYSAHADQQTLCDWVNSMPEPPGEIRLRDVSPTRDFNYVLDTCKGFNDLAGIKLTSTTYKLQGID